MNTTDTSEEPRYTPEWLELREGADAAARATESLAPLRRHLRQLAKRSIMGSAQGSAEGSAQHSPQGPAQGSAQHLTQGPVQHPAQGSPQNTPLLIRDLGCGTGSMGRWLAPRLDGPQHWILHDTDPALLDLAVAQMPAQAADGSPVTVATEQGDIAALTAADLAGTSLVTASALLDLLTRDEVDALATACAQAGCAALFALSVAGLVELAPPDPLDATIAASFDAHQRRTEHGRRLLGPDAVTATEEAFARHDATVFTYAAPWRLAAAESVLTAQWLRGWVGAAREQRPDLAPRAHAYLRRRLAEAAARELRVVVHHHDLLALPRSTGETS
ncbi:class I SAM-dependent methyltransferase [Streptomyces sp. NPDC006638]|uniref:class I SAM-dependent methyltransferase n=1 Tax=Streptomyces sp. NPDC006638 TaxID=3157183 RepID=UPI0033B9D1F2